MSYYLCKNSGIHHAHCPNPGEFCPKSAVKAAFEKNAEEKSSDDFERTLSVKAFPAAPAPPRGRPLRRSRARFPLLSPTVTSSPGAGEVFPQRESQAVKFGTKVLGTTRNLLGVLLALPLGELAKPTALTERAHAASLVTNVSKAIKNFAATTKSRPLEGVLHKKCRAVRRLSGIALFFTSYCGTPAVRFGNRGSGCRRPRWW